MTSHDACTSGTSRVLTVSLQRLKLEAHIPAPGNCEVRFLNAHSTAQFEIRRQLCQVYGPNVMSKQMVRRWCRHFTAGQQHVHIDECSGRPSIITDDLVELVRERLWKIVASQWRNSTVISLQISRFLLHENVTVHLLFRNCAPAWCQTNWYQNTKQGT